MKEIKLTQGKVALVDDSDFEWLNQWKWYASKHCKTFYACRALSRKVNNGKQATIFMHRQILSPTSTEILTDHIDNNGLNNQRNNLRQATFLQSSLNRTRRRGSNSKYKGVRKISSSYKDNIYYYWRATIGINGKTFNIGAFKSEIDAAVAYNKKALELHGEFSNLNKVA